jgi:hypothetical protein
LERKKDSSSFKTKRKFKFEDALVEFYYAFFTFVQYFTALCQVLSASPKHLSIVCEFFTLHLQNGSNNFCSEESH